MTPRRMQRLQGPTPSPACAPKSIASKTRSSSSPTLQARFWQWVGISCALRCYIIPGICSPWQVLSYSELRWRNVAHMASLRMCRPRWVGVAFAAVVLVVTASCVGTASARLLEGDIRAAVLGKDEEDSTVTVAVPDEVDHVLNVEGADLNTKFQVYIQRLSSNFFQCNFRCSMHHGEWLGIKWSEWSLYRNDTPWLHTGVSIDSS